MYSLRACVVCVCVCVREIERNKWREREREKDALIENIPFTCIVPIYQLAK